MKINIKRNFLVNKISDVKIDNELKKEILILLSTSDSDLILTETKDISVELLTEVLKESSGLSSVLKAKLSQEILDNNMLEITEDSKSIWDTKIKNLADIVQCFSLLGVRQFNAEIKINKRWYPIVIQPRFHPATKHSYAHVNISILVTFMNEANDMGWNFYMEHFKDAFGKLRKISLRDLFHSYNCRPLEGDLDDNEKSINRAEDLMSQNGKQMLLNGYKINVTKLYRESHLHISKIDYHERIIIESDLEYDVEKKDSLDQYTQLPFIRVFSLVNKTYFFVDARDLEPYQYDKNAINKLILPTNIKEYLTKVFSASKEAMYGDILKHKSGGMIILATGKPGIGKTSSAEVYSESKEMPLYAMDISEIGTNANNVEKYLSVIFKRVEKWNAIVLFDEVDVFLSKRDNDLERSAIVGIFLRLMDYFRGVMFFTTNRPEVIDSAIVSRITLQVKYPDLDLNARLEIWKSKFADASFSITDGYDELVKLELNGRQIRNMVRLAKIIFGNKASQNQMKDMIQSSIQL